DDDPGGAGRSRFDGVAGGLAARAAFPRRAMAERRPEDLAGVEDGHDLAGAEDGGAGGEALPPQRRGERVDDDLLLAADLVDEDAGRRAAAGGRDHRQ